MVQQVSPESLPLNSQSPKIAVLGLGYVGLPLALAFSKYYPTIGFDTNQQRVDSLIQCEDSSGEVLFDELNAAGDLSFTCQPDDLVGANVFIVSVPTPVTDHKRPDLSALKAASGLVGQFLKSGNVVIFESTVFPGATEDICLPVLEQVSGLKLNQDFYLGYSPERINPGSASHTLANVTKVTSGSNDEAAEFIDQLYQKIVEAGTYKAPSIKVAEAAKVIENVQRDLNIALMNELAIIFDKLNIDTQEVLSAAKTKWNFLPFEPGLVGGHCIGVDPYYLTHKAEEKEYHPDVILAGRRINDGMGAFVADKLVKLLVQNGINLQSAKILILGATFKENCRDLRNTRVIDIVNQLKTWGLDITIWEPWGEPQQIEEACQCAAVTELPAEQYDGVLLAVAHDQFKAITDAERKNLIKSGGVIYDVKSAWPKEWSTARL